MRRLPRARHAMSLLEQIAVHQKSEPEQECGQMFRQGYFPMTRRPPPARLVSAPDDLTRARRWGRGGHGKRLACGRGCLGLEAPPPPVSALSRLGRPAKRIILVVIIIVIRSGIIISIIIINAIPLIIIVITNTLNIIIKPLPISAITIAIVDQPQHLGEARPPGTLNPHWTREEHPPEPPRTRTKDLGGRTDGSEGGGRTGRPTSTQGEAPTTG